MEIARSPRHGQENVIAAVGWILITTFLFVCVHATGKYLVARYPVGQVVWGRYVFHLAFAALVLGPKLGRVVRTRQLRLQLVRSGFMFGATVFYFAGVRYLPLAEANAIAFTTPILVMALAWPVLRERVGRRRWIGAGIGLLGALIVIRPGSGAMELAAGLLLASSLCNACYQIATRKLGAGEETLATLFYTALVGSLGASILLAFGWQPMDLEAWLLFALIGGFACAGHFTLIRAYKSAPASVVAPFTYTNLIWAAAFGFALFGDLPGLWTIVGAGIIVASGLYILHRERIAAGRR